MEMISYNQSERGRVLRIAVGITMLGLLLAGGAGATKSINSNATGGDCASIGTWNVASKTCTLKTDLSETIEIDSDVNVGELCINCHGGPLTDPSRYLTLMLGKYGKMTRLFVLLPFFSLHLSS
jgi:hypothetical protein